ncbi:hypothetical protein KGQ27_02830 [Patescibacteria group bacterium]|nr:hypothetical protein [Patescibacteria group bacterium]MDE1946803.1 glycosyltransferase family 9 protein [Patescibacteria group bacterium]MDE2011141.1 glycosyltransferase family 9 protein [Patescibacteria group bacterium]MDE2233050.1 glycosyltransferase family 9 protein [Patescibacteria group bacterium]
MKKGSTNRIIWMSFGPIGDTLLMLAFFDDLLRLEPDMRFTVLASTNVKIIRELSSAYPSIEVVQIPEILGMLPFLAKLFRYQSTVIVPGVARTYSSRLKYFFYLLSMRPGNLVVGFKEWTGMQGWLPFDKSYGYDFKMSIINNYRRLIPDFLPGKNLEPRPPRVNLNLHKPVDFPFKSGGYFVVHMFGTRARYSFPPKRWRSLLYELRRIFPGYRLVLTGAKKDEVIIKEITSGIEGILLFINRPVLEVASIIHDSALYIGVDTGITHLAAVQGIKSVVIGHNTDPMWLPRYNPNGVILTNNSRCLCKGDKVGSCTTYEDGKEYRRCTYDLTVEDVIMAIHDKLSSS